MSEAFSWKKVLGEEIKLPSAADEQSSTPPTDPTQVPPASTVTPPQVVAPPVVSSGPSAQPVQAPPAVPQFSVPLASDSLEEILDQIPEKPSQPLEVVCGGDQGTTVPPPPLTTLEGDATPTASVPPATAKSASPHIPAPVPESLLIPDANATRYETAPEETLLNEHAVEGAMPLDNVHLDDILRMAVDRKASDIHITAGLPPMMRLDGEVVPLPYEPLEPHLTRRLIYDTLSNEQLQKFEQTHELDFGYGVRGCGRFRMNVYMQRGSLAAALRVIPTKIPSFDELGLPSIIREIAKRTSGLVLVTGPTGSGKSTTIATMIDDINSTRTSHILTIEDPIEYLHSHKKCMVNQREVHSDTYSFHNSLRAVLREDPDIILVGELRDLETIEAALTLAETGHLVFGTLHTRNAPSTVDRMVDVFPSDQQAQIRVLLGNTLEGVISQQLLPRLGGGRSAAIEIMTGTAAIKNLIREGKTHQMYSVIETSKNLGMQTMDSSLATLFKTGKCSYEECLMRAVDKDTFARLAKG